MSLVLWVATWSGPAGPAPFVQGSAVLVHRKPYDARMVERKPYDAKLIHRKPYGGA